MGNLPTVELDQLRAFRKAAAKVRSRSVIDQGHTVNLAIEPTGKVMPRLLGQEPFVALLTAVRLVYMEGEPAHFFRIHNILFRHGSPDIGARSAAIRRRYKAS